MGKKSFDNLHSSFFLAITSGIPVCNSGRLNFDSVVDSLNNIFANCMPLSVCRASGIPCSANDYFMIDTVFAALHWDAGFLQIIGIGAVVSDSEVLRSITLQEVCPMVYP